MTTKQATTLIVRLLTVPFLIVFGLVTITLTTLYFTITEFIPETVRDYVKHGKTNW